MTYHWSRKNPLPKSSEICVLEKSIYQWSIPGGYKLLNKIICTKTRLHCRLLRNTLILEPQMSFSESRRRVPSSTRPHMKRKLPPPPPPWIQSGSWHCKISARWKSSSAERSPLRRSRRSRIMRQRSSCGPHTRSSNTPSRVQSHQPGKRRSETSARQNKSERRDCACPQSTTVTTSKVNWRTAPSCSGMLCCWFLLALLRCFTASRVPSGHSGPGARGAVQWPARLQEASSGHRPSLKVGRYFAVTQVMIGYRVSTWLGTFTLPVWDSRSFQHSRAGSNRQGSTKI